MVAGVRAELTLTRVLGLRAQLGTALPLTRPQFELAGIAPVHSPALAAVRASLGLEARF